MKIILSRKGFDGSNGGCPSPILPDGTLLSMPIPTPEEKTLFSDLQYEDIGYDILLSGLNPKQEYCGCHLDPDIRGEIHKKKYDKWKPAFGQVGAAQGTLQNAGVGIGDIFLFFGLFRAAEFEGKTLRYVKGSPAKQIVYGYLQIGDMYQSNEEIKAYKWHPHSEWMRNNNTLYIPTDTLSFSPDKSGYDVLDYNETRVLTKEGASPANWKNYEFLQPQCVYGNRKNNSRCGGLYYQGIWQELILSAPSEEAKEWLKEIICI